MPAAAIDFGALRTTGIALVDRLEVGDRVVRQVGADRRAERGLDVARLSRSRAKALLSTNRVVAPTWPVSVSCSSSRCTALSAGISGSTGITTVSDRLKIASIRSSSDAPPSTMTTSYASSARASTSSTVSAVISDAKPGADGRREDLDAARVVDGVGAEQLGLAQGRLVARELQQGLLRLQVEVRRHLAEREVEVDQQDAARVALAGDQREVRRDGRGPDAALRADHGHDPATASRRRWTSRRRTSADRSRDRWKRSDRASTRASSSVWSNGLVMTSSAPASSRPIRSSRSSFWATASTGSMLGRLVAAELLDDGGDRERRRDLVDDHQAVAGGRREQLDRGRRRSSHRGRAPSGRW